LNLKSPGVCFQTKVKKGPLLQTGALLFHCGKSYSDMSLKLFTLDGLSKLNRSLSLPSFFVVHLVWLLFVNWLFTLFTFICSSKRVIQSEKYKSHFNWERPCNSENETAYTVPK